MSAQSRNKRLLMIVAGFRRDRRDRRFQHVVTFAWVEKADIVVFVGDFELGDADQERCWEVIDFLLWTVAILASEQCRLWLLVVVPSLTESVFQSLRRIDLLVHRVVRCQCRKRRLGIFLLLLLHASVEKVLFCDYNCDYNNYLYL